MGAHQGNLDVKAVSAINSMPLLLNTRNPDVKTIKDFTSKDKIALAGGQGVDPGGHPADGGGKGFRRGPAEQARSADGVDVASRRETALLSGASEITAHFTSPPFQYQELEKPAIHTVLNSFDVLGGPATFNVVWTTSKFRNENPKLYEAFVKALDEAIAAINRDKRAAAEAYLRISKNKDSVEDIAKMLDDPSIVYTTTPQNVMKYVNFMLKIGSIKVKPDSWKDLFFPERPRPPGKLMRDGVQRPTARAAATWLRRARAADRPARPADAGADQRRRSMRRSVPPCISSARTCSTSARSRRAAPPTPCSRSPRSRRAAAWSPIRRATMARRSPTPRRGAAFPRGS